MFATHVTELDMQCKVNRRRTRGGALEELDGVEAHDKICLSKVARDKLHLQLGPALLQPCHSTAHAATRAAINVQLQAAQRRVSRQPRKQRFTPPHLSTESAEYRNALQLCGGGCQGLRAVAQAIPTGAQLPQAAYPGAGRQAGRLVVITRDSASDAQALKARQAGKSWQAGPRVFHAQVEACQVHQLPQRPIKSLACCIIWLSIAGFKKHLHMVECGNAADIKGLSSATDAGDPFSPPL